MDVSQPTEVDHTGSGNPYYDDVVESPIAINALFGAEVRRRLVHFFLLDADPDIKYNKSRISDETGIARSSVVEHIGDLVAFGVVEETGENRPRYTLGDDEIIERLIELNEMLVDQYTD